MRLGGAGPWRESLALFSVLWLFFLATSSREWPRGQARSAYDVAAQLVAHGSLVTTYGYPAADPSRDGRKYSPMPLAHSLVQVPPELLRAQASRVDAEAGECFTALAGNLSMCAFGALACVLLFRLARRMGARRGLALAGAFTLGLGTYLWAFSRTTFVEPLLAAAFLGFFGALLAFDEAPGRRRGLILGAWAGLLVNVSLAHALALPGALALVLLGARRRQALRGLGWAALAFVPLVVPIALYDWYRFGSITATGLATGPLTASAWHGLWALLFSANKSLFLYAAPIALSVVVAPSFVRSWPRAAWAMVATIAPVLWFHFKLVAWPGDWSWGPRLALFAVPVLLLPAVVHAGELWPRVGGRAVRVVKGAALVGVLAFALFISVLGVAFAWDHGETMGRQIQWSWLGRPNDSFSITNGAYENHYGLDTLPVFDPIEMHLWFLGHVLRHHTWERAQADAPWRPYSTVKPGGMEPGWKRVALDWWYPDFAARCPRNGHATLVILLLGLGGAIAGLVVCLRAQRPDLAADT